MTPANPYNGETHIEIAGHMRTLRYTWSAILELRATFGDDFDSVLVEALQRLDLDALSKALVIGLRASWPDVTAETLMQESPPVSTAIQAVQTALHRAFHGGGLEVKKPTENPLRAALSRLRTIWTQILGPQSSPA